MGSSWVMVTSVVWLACTELPGKTLIAPTRPAPGALTRMYDSDSRADSSAARSAATAAACDSTAVCAASTAPCETKFCASSSRLRASWRFASASAASSRAIWARTRATLASSGRASSENSGSPTRTNWPSRMCTRVMSDVACGRTSTVDAGTTVPVASSVIGTSRLTAGTVLTLTGGADAAAPGADAAAASAGAGALAANAADAALSATASDLPPQAAIRQAVAQTAAPRSGNVVFSTEQE